MSQPTTEEPTLVDEDAEGTPLSGWVVAVPESRQLDVLTDMLTVRGASVIRCPLVSIHDSPNEEGVKQWLIEFCTGDFDDFIILTGEGIRRLSGFAERFEMLDAWVGALSKVRKIARGPKPGSALRLLKLKPEVLASTPTTDGVMDTLAQEQLTGRKIAVQLYGEVQNEKLQNFLRDKGANISIIAPYIYASDSEASAVSSLIDALMDKKVDILVFTSVVQIKRLVDVAKAEDREPQLLSALKQTNIAAIGPIVEALLKELELPITVVPDEKFFMKPLVRKLVTFVEENSK